MRNTYIETLTEMSRKNPNIICVIGDTGFSVFEDYEKEFKERFVNIGIAEQDFVSFGAGLAAMGMKPYIYNVASFMTLRALEQIVLDICYQENPVVLVGVGGGHAYGQAGPTHHSGFDIAAMRMLPDMTIVCPGDPIEMREVMLASETYDKPLYIRIGRSVDEIVHESPIDFKIGKPIKMSEGQDIVLLAAGTMLKDAVKVKDILKESGIPITLFSMPTVKPLNREFICEIAAKNKALFTLEEHSVIGGLGSAAAEVLAEETNVPKVIFKRFGFPDMFAPVTGTREYLNKLYKIDSESVANEIQSIIKNN